MDPLRPPSARRLSSFVQVSLDGFYCGPNGDMSFAQKPPEDTEWQAYVNGNASGGGMLLFGRVTYDMMAAWWPTPEAAKVAPVVADRMNAMPKVVFSRTLTAADWINTTLVKGDLVESVAALKREEGPEIATLGSGSIVRQLAAAGLVDTFQIGVVPVVLGSGKSLFAGVTRRLDLVLTSSRAFANGTVVLGYVPG